MAPDPLASITTRATPQTQPAAGLEGARQKQNTAGGYTFTVTAETRVRRFLTLGTDGGTYYANERAITQDNAKVILDAARHNGPWLALRTYQNRIGVKTKLIVVGMTATEFTIADPEDPTMLDVAGFDASVPNLIADFSRGEL